SLRYLPDLPGHERGDVLTADADQATDAEMTKLTSLDRVVHAAPAHPKHRGHLVHGVGPGVVDDCRILASLCCHRAHARVLLSRFVRCDPLSSLQVTITSRRLVNMNDEN